MKLNSSCYLAVAIVAGAALSGCSQMSAQQVADTAPAAKPVAKPAPRPQVQRPRPQPVRRADPNRHTHPAIPNCTDSISHSHPNGAGRHNHRYSCRRAAPQRRTGGHTHPAIPNCTNSVTHHHRSGDRQHSHRYSCRRPAMRSMVKPKGTYRGAIQMDQGVMKTYQQ